MNKEQYLQGIRAQVQAAQTKNANAAAAIETARSHQDYEQALRQVAVIRDPQQVGQAIEILRDNQAPAALREEILQKATSAIGEKPEYIAICLDILRDQAAPVSLRKAVLRTLKALSFSSKTLVSLRSQFLATLRELLDDPDASLREMITEELAQSKDELVQRRLVDSLTDRASPIVSVAKAIQLLGYDIHGAQYPLVRQVLRDPSVDEMAKIEAIHVLANDTESQDLLTSLMFDKDQPKEIRMSSAVALQSMHPAEFAELAKPLILDETDYDDIRLVALNSLIQHQNKGILQRDPELRKKISELSNAAKSSEVGRVSREFLQRAAKLREEEPQPR